MLKEARIVMPFNRKLTAQTNNAVHSQLRAKLVGAFGGYTLTTGSGGWLDAGQVYQDDVCVYDVAINTNVDAMIELRSIATQAGHALGQEAVYTRWPDGRVEIIHLIAPCGIVDFGEGTMPTPVANTHASGGAIPWREAEDKHDAGNSFLKRLPQVGEVWESHCGALIAVMTQASVLDGGYNAVSLTAGDSAVAPGRNILLDMDGKMYGGSKGDPRPFDLKLFVKRFVRD